MSLKRKGWVCNCSCRASLLLDAVVWCLWNLCPFIKCGEGCMILLSYGQVLLFVNDLHPSKEIFLIA